MIPFIEQYIYKDEGIEVVLLIEEKPELPPEVWQTQKPDADKCMQEVRMMCEGYRNG